LGPSLVDQFTYEKASCSKPVIDVVPVGSLQHGVVFYLGDIFRPHPEFTVTGVTVEDQSDGS
jgi:hypothetical protein